MRDDKKELNRGQSESPTEQSGAPPISNVKGDLSRPNSTPSGKEKAHASATAHILRDSGPLHHGMDHIFISDGLSSSKEEDAYTWMHSRRIGISEESWEGSLAMFRNHHHPRGTPATPAGQVPTCE